MVACRRIAVSRSVGKKSATARTIVVLPAAYRPRRRKQSFELGLARPLFIPDIRGSDEAMAVIEADVHVQTEAVVKELLAQPGGSCQRFQRRH